MSNLQLALDLMGELVLEDGSRWGDAAADFQREDARAVLDPDSSTPYHFLTRARNGSKTVDLAGMWIAAALTQLPQRSRSYALAADRDQGRQLVDALEGFLERTPILHGRLIVETWKVTIPDTGSTLEVLAADAASSWGLRPAFVIVDELAQWAEVPSTRKLWTSIRSSVAKVPAGRLVVLTSAGDPAHFSHKALLHAEESELWRVHEVSGPAPWTSPERLAEQCAALWASEFARLWQNEWTASEDRLSSLDDLRACVTLQGPLAFKGRHAPYVVALDVGVRSDRTVGVVAHAEPVRDEAGSEIGRRVFLDRMEVWSGTREAPVDLSAVEEWCLHASRAFGSARVVADPWQAISLVQRLQAAGVAVSEFNFTAASVGHLALALHDVIRQHLLAIPDDPELLDELANVRLRESSPGVYRLDHDASRHDDRAVCLAMAALTLLEEPPRQPDFFVGTLGGDTGWTIFETR